MLYYLCLKPNFLAFKIKVCIASGNNNPVVEKFKLNLNSSGFILIIVLFGQSFNAALLFQYLSYITKQIRFSCPLVVVAFPHNIFLDMNRIQFDNHLI